MSKRLLIPLTVALGVLAFAAPSALASTSQVTILQDNAAINKNAEAALVKMKAMGATMVKYVVYWNQYAPDANSKTAPAAATDPNAYETSGSFGGLDEVVTDAHALGLKLGFMVTGPAPRWAETSTANCTSSNVAAGSCRVSTSDYETFIKALGERYNGAYTLSSGATLPAVTWWSVWNEPNYVPNIAPQLVGSTNYFAADEYRNLVNAAWVGLHATGHASGNQFIFGELAPRGISGGNAANQGAAATSSGMKPVQFLAALYCETSSGKRMTGAIAAANGCSSSAAAFKKANPGLFSANGVADHPYSQGVAPNVPTYDCNLSYVSPKNAFCENPKTKKSDPLWTDLASISNLENGLAKDLRAYGSGEKYPIWNTEYGYWTKPTGHIPCTASHISDCDLSTTEASYYLNWAEYVSYTNPRIVSFDQYQLYQPTSGGWTDGLLTSGGVPLQTYDAWEVPLYMPTTSAKSAGNLTVWGGARPATADSADDTVEIQFKGKSGGWTTLKTATVNSATGYFDTKVRFTASGSVRLAYAVTGAASLTSRTQAITVK